MNIPPARRRLEKRVDGELLGAGLGLRERWYRLMGLGTLAIALVSLAPIIFEMETQLMRIASLFVMGCVFLGLGFVYTRFHEQLKKLL